jgi:hypothetical protein
MVPFKTRQILLEITLKAPTKASRTLRLTQPSLEQVLTRQEIHSCIVGPMFEAGQGLTPLPEDLMMRGLLWTEQYFPEDWFYQDQDKRGDRERDIIKCRDARLLKLGFKLSQVTFAQSYRDVRFG